jgi:hypothetical protein
MNNDDYLWAKIGSDPEIERLENALSVFRGRDRAEPAANVTPFRPRARKSQLAFAYAAAACLLLAALVGSVLLRDPGADDAILAGVPKAEETQVVVPTFDRVVPPKEELSASTTRVAKNAIEQTIVAARTNASVAVRQKATPKASAATRKQSLTKEEKYAYGQLMLALSITSSNLRLVADKIDIQDASADGGR